MTEPKITAVDKLALQRQKSVARERERARAVAILAEQETVKAVAREMGCSTRKARELLNEAGVGPRRIGRPPKKAKAGEGAA